MEIFIVVSLQAKLCQGCQVWFCRDSFELKCLADALTFPTPPEPNLNFSTESPGRVLVGESQSIIIPHNEEHHMFLALCKLNQNNDN